MNNTLYGQFGPEIMLCIPINVKSLNFEILFEAAGL